VNQRKGEESTTQAGETPFRSKRRGADAAGALSEARRQVCGGSPSFVSISFGVLHDKVVDGVFVRA
jgi:hypothetical protein